MKSVEALSDHELLQLSAKAYGYKRSDLYDCFVINSAGYKALDRNGLVSWNPIAEGGDALRLAVKLGMNIEVLLDHNITIVDCLIQAEAEHNGDPDKATRRAIVLAAAKIARTME